MPAQIAPALRVVTSHSCGQSQLHYPSRMKGNEALLRYPGVGGHDGYPSVSRASVRQRAMANADAKRARALGSMREWTGSSARAGRGRSSRRGQWSHSV